VMERVDCRGAASSGADLCKQERPCQGEQHWISFMYQQEG
jgi:hypothetical protein